MNNNTFHKLIYIWYDSYKGNLFHQQGIPLTGEYQIQTTPLPPQSDPIQNIFGITVSVKIRKNPHYSCPSNFYGKNIDMVTALVGENGSGKTTLAQMLLDSPLPSIHELPPFFWITCSDDGSLAAYSYHMAIKHSQEEQGEPFSIHKWEPSSPPVHMVFLTNVWNFFELTEDITFDSLNRSDHPIRQSYSPATLLLHSSEIARTERYGYRTNDNKYLTGIQYYAETMESSPVFSYIKRQEELMIQCYKNTSQSVREMLGIFKEYVIAPAIFAPGIRTWSSQNGQDEKSQLLVQAKQCYEKLKPQILKDQESNLCLNMYVLCLTEAYLALPNQEDEEIIKIKTYIENTRALDRDHLTLLRQIVAWAQETLWSEQITECLDMLEQYLDEQSTQEHHPGSRKFPHSISRWQTGYQDFDDSEEMLEWYYRELQKPSSFFKRNLSFRLLPSSSGEQAIINLFGYLTDAMNQNSKQREFLVIIDEIDAGLHPRWQQNILKYLFDWLESFQEYRFQLIITSHSPIVLSDMLKEHVVRLKKKSGQILHAEMMEKPTFGANIADQFLDTFFMDEGNIGAFSKEKIQKIIHEIVELTQYIPEKNKELRYLIESIGEDMVRNKLLYDLSRKRAVGQRKKLTEKWEEYSEEEQREMIDYMEKMKKEKERQ